MKTNQDRKFAVVTGASSGIGYELAKQFAQNDYDLLVVAENSGIMRAANRLMQYGGRVEGVRIDLATYEGVEELGSVIRSIRRPVEAIAINAGVGVGGEFSRTSLEDEINLINLNVISTVHLAKRIVQHMQSKSRGGRILFTASIAATMPGPYEAVYAASKAFILSFSEALRHELKDKGISVTALMPGATETNFFHRAGMDDTQVGQNKKDDPAEVARQGFEALMAGQDHVIAGSFKTRAMNYLNDLIPETTKAKMHANMAKPGSAGASAAKDKKMDIYAYLKKDHRLVEDLMEKVAETEDKKQRKQLFNRIKEELALHADTEEATFYKAVEDAARSAGGEEEIEHADKEHEDIRHNLEQLSSMSVDDSQWMQVFNQLKDSVTHHVDEEEDKIFETAKAHLSEEEAIALAAEMEKLKTRQKAKKVAA